MKKAIIVLLLWGALTVYAVDMYFNDNKLLVKDNGSVKYSYAHAVISADDVTYTPTVTKDVYTKLVPSSTCRHYHNITCQGDTLTIADTFDGDYDFNISVRLSGANQNDAWQIKIYKNAEAMGSSVGRFVFRTTAAGQADTRYFFWYLEDLVGGDDISFYITNLTATRNPTIVDFKVYVEQKPE